MDMLWLLLSICYFMALTFGSKFEHWFLELGEYNSVLSTECLYLAGM